MSDVLYEDPELVDIEDVESLPRLPCAAMTVDLMTYIPMQVDLCGAPVHVEAVTHNGVPVTHNGEPVFIVVEN